MPSLQPSHPPPGPGLLRRSLEGAAAFLVYSLVTLVDLRPVWAVWRDHLTPDLGDPLFNLWVLQWGMRQVELGFPDPWNANIFFPFDRSLALSDHLFGPALLGLPVDAVTGSPVAAYNALFVLSFPLAGLVTYGVLRALGLRPLPALLGGAVFAFSPYRWGQASHLQMLFAPWIPAVLWSFDRLLAAPRARRAALFLAVYGLHVTGGVYLAYLVHLPLLVLALHRALTPPGWRRWLGRRAMAVLLVTALLAATVLTALFVPYLQVAARLDLSRGAENFVLYGTTLPALLTPAPSNLHFDALAPLLRAVNRRTGDADWWAERTLFPGVLPLALALVAGIALWRRHRRPSEPRPPAARRLLTAVPIAVATAAFLTGELFTLGLWPTGGPGLIHRPGAVYSALGLVLAAALAAALALHRRWGRPRPPHPAALSTQTRGLLWAGLACLLISFPVVYEPLAELLPGLYSMRVPARLHAITSFFVAAAAAAGAQILLDRVTPAGRRRAAGAALLAVAVLELMPAPLPWHAVPGAADLPPVHGWIARQGEEVEGLLVLPLDAGAGALNAMHHSTAHWRPLVNGYSAHVPPHVMRLRASCCRPAPDARDLELLRRWGVTHLLVHPRPALDGDHDAWEAWRRRAAAGGVPGVWQVYEDALGDRVYALRPPPTPR